jgi:alpha-tubulin suppressor-like RCC1 family protein
MTNMPAGLDNHVVAVASGLNHALVLKDDGTVTGWGTIYYPAPADLAGVQAIAAGGAHSLALLSNGTVRVWGDPNLPPPAMSGVQQLAAGDYHNLALRAGGMVTYWDSQTAATLIGSGAVGIAAGANHSLVLMANGTVVAFAHNYSGNTYGQCDVPSSVRQAIAVAAGKDFSLALCVYNGTTVIYGWGSTADNRIYPPASTVGASAIAAGPDHGLALRGGRVIGWGNNTCGQSSVPAGISNAVAMAGGMSHSLALVLEPPRITAQPQSQVAVEGDRISFSVGAGGSSPLSYQWRKDSVDLPSATNATYTLYSAQTNHVGGYTVVVRNAAGSVTSSVATLTVSVPASIVQQPTGYEVPAGTNVVFKVVARGTDVLYQWRKNGTNLPFTYNPNYATLTLPGVKVSDAGTYSVAVSNQWGYQVSANATLLVHSLPVITNQPGSATVVAGKPVTFQVGAAEATGYQWQKDGVDLPGETRATLGLDSAQAGDAGSYLVVVSNPWGKTVSAPATLTVQPAPPPAKNIVLWGERLVLVNNNYVDMIPPGGLDDAVAIAAGGYHHLVIRRGGAVEGWGANDYGQAKPFSSISNAVAVAAGGFHSLALLSNGKVVAWGQNDYGQTNVPPGLAGVAAVAAGAYHSLALRSNGTVVAWGSSAWGQTNVLPNLTNALGIAAGRSHSLAISNRAVVAWGTNDYSQKSIPAGLSNVVAIAAGDYHSLALKQDGTVVAWGRADLRATAVPPDLRDVVAIAAGSNHSLALKRDGTVVGWGDDNYGQTEIPTGLAGVFAIAAGGNRSLALRRPPLLLQAPAKLANGFAQVLAGNADGSPITQERAPRISVYATTNLFLDMAHWDLLSASSPPTNGQLIFYEGRRSQRFYRAVEQP